MTREQALKLSDVFWRITIPVVFFMLSTAYIGLRSDIKELTDAVNRQTTSAAVMNGQIDELKTKTTLCEQRLLEHMLETKKRQ